MGAVGDRTATDGAVTPAPPMRFGEASNYSGFASLFGLKNMVALP